MTIAKKKVGYCLLLAISFVYLIIDISEYMCVYYIVLLVLEICFSFDFFKENIKEIKKDISQKKFEDKFMKMLVDLFFTIIFFVTSNILMSHVIKNNYTNTITKNFDYIITALFLGPIVEEILYRGYIWKFFDKSKLIAHFTSAVVFAFAHIVVVVWNYGWTIDYMCFMIPYMFMGLGFSVIYEKNDNIVYPVIAHSLINCMSLIY